jgi:superfamily I DNA and/or RNA helicase
LAVIPSSAERIILVGDHQQISPRVTVAEVGKHGFGQSMMTRLEKAGLPTIKLNVQNRMGVYLSMFLRDIYPEYKDGPLAKTIFPPPTFPTGVFLWEYQSRAEGRSEVQNLREVELLMYLVAYAVRGGHLPSDIAILSYYSAQVKAIEAGLARLDEEGIFLTGIHVSTVDAFQGAEREIVFLSTVRQHRLGFVNNPGRRCVALSRAKRVLIILANPTVLNLDPAWKRYILSLDFLYLVSPTFHFRCDKHHDIWRRVHSGDPITDIPPMILHGSRCLCEIIEHNTPGVWPEGLERK